MIDINSSCFLFEKRRSKQVRAKSFLPTQISSTQLLFAEPAQYSLNSEQKFKTVSKELMSTHLYKYTLRNMMELTIFVSEETD